ncbi:MAG: hypothetical protein HRU21_05355 [Pseudomonadales bacterium]|nr:hypothetical protein [Pseudomonadales bacterium]
MSKLSVTLANRQGPTCGEMQGHVRFADAIICGFANIQWNVTCAKHKGRLQANLQQLRKAQSVI